MGGGSGGGLPSRFSRIHEPRVTGDVRFGAEVTVIERDLIGVVGGDQVVEGVQDADRHRRVDDLPVQRGAGLYPEGQVVRRGGGQQASAASD